MKHTINDTSKLSNLVTTVLDENSFTLKAVLTTEQDITLNAVLHCTANISGDMATSERMISWLRSVSLHSYIHTDKSNRIMVPFAFLPDLDAGANKAVLNIRLCKSTSGRWFILSTCIAELGLPVANDVDYISGAITQVRTDTDS
jgi:hypothetical protein